MNYLLQIFKIKLIKDNFVILLNEISQNFLSCKKIMKSNMDKIEVQNWRLKIKIEVKIEDWI